MKRHLFFILCFPPAFMNLLLVRAHPTDLVFYFLAAYPVAWMPAVAISLTDELFERAAVATRALWCGLVGGAFSPLAMLLIQRAGVFHLVEAAACGALVGFLCAVVFCRTFGRERPVSIAIPAADLEHLH